MKRRGFIGGLLSAGAATVGCGAQVLPPRHRELKIVGRLPPDPNVLVARGTDFPGGTIPKKLHLFLGVLPQDWTIALPVDIRDGEFLTVRIRKFGICNIDEQVVVSGAQTVLGVRARRDGCCDIPEMLTRGV